MSLRAAFSAEAGKNYQTLIGEDLKGFCHFIAFLWQIHPFYEGNTRTVAVFFELYLNTLGFDVANEPFEKHARYYRDALVRAMYRNVPAKVYPDQSFLCKFYDNTANGANHVLDQEELLCASLFDNPALLRNVNSEYALKK